MLGDLSTRENKTPSKKGTAVVHRGPLPTGAPVGWYTLGSGYWFQYAPQKGHLVLVSVSNPFLHFAQIAITLTLQKGVHGGSIKAAIAAGKLPVETE